GDEVLTLEPFYDSYAAVIAMAGATHTTAPLRATPAGFRLDLEAARAAFSERTRVLLLNAPHTPTGAALDRTALAVLTHLAQAHGDDLPGGQDLLLHGLEDRLVARPRAPRRGDPHRQAVPHLHLGRPLAARGRPRPQRRGRAALGRRARRGPRLAPGPAVRRARVRGLRGRAARGDLLRARR